MKNFKHLIFAFLALFLTACPGDIVDPDKGDSSKQKSDLLKRKIEEIISSDIIDQAKALGMPIFDGISPPDIIGSYILDDQTMKKSNIEDDDPVGSKYVDEIITITGQNNENFTLSLKIEAAGETHSYSAIISGSGDRFTLYTSLKIFFDDGTSTKAAMLYSGSLKDGELHNVYYGMFLTEEPYAGLGHIIYEADGVAKRYLGDDPGEDGGEIIEATGETAKGSYSGSDLTMQFPSKLKVSIKASNNQGADHGEITVSEYSEFPMMELGDNIVLDFSETASVYTVDIEAFIAKGLNAKEDIDCFLFTTDRQTVEASDGRIHKGVEFDYDKATGKLTLSTKVNTPFSETKASGGRFSHLAIYVTPDYNFEAETVTMKAPYVEQLDNTCWAACAMMFIRSYTNLEPDMRNSYLAFVKKMRHKRLDQGWTTNFFTYWKYDTGNLVSEIERMIGGGVKISCSSFRRTNSAAREMVRLIKQKKPAILNHGDHVLYVIGYSREEKGGAISFLVHDPQGVSGDIYKWIDWDDYLKKVKFNEAFFRGDIIYIIYADRPMLDDPILQTMAVATADTEKFIRPAGTDLTFYMQAYGKSRMVFPQYDVNELYGLRWGKKGYDEENLSNDTIYSLSKLTVGMKVYNADDKAASMFVNMNIAAGSVFKYYTANISCPAGGEYRVKGNEFKTDDGAPFDPTLKDFTKQQGDPDLYVEFSCRNLWGSYDEIDRFEYPGLVIKSEATEEPEAFQALRPILKDIYRSATGKQWFDSYVWLEKSDHYELGYDIITAPNLGLFAFSYLTFDKKPCFRILLDGDADYINNIKVGNHPLPDDWIWELECEGIIGMPEIREIEIINDSFANLLTGDGNNYIEKVTISSTEKCGVNISRKSGGYSNNSIDLDFKQSDVDLQTAGIKNITIKSGGRLTVEVKECEQGELLFRELFGGGKIEIYANNFKVAGNDNSEICQVVWWGSSSSERGKLILSGLNCLRVLNRGSKLLSEIEIDSFTSETLEVSCDYVQKGRIEKLDIMNCYNLKNLILIGKELSDLNVSNCSNIEYADLLECPLFGGSFKEWPQFLQYMFNTGKGKGIEVRWRYLYTKECDEDGENCEYKLFHDSRSGFYFDEGEPEDVDIYKYRQVGFSYNL